ncbi:MAG TPA: hypothetical protein PKA37_07080, partial [Planctomycetota bacterium]|nr:hypothetical protein [Planctomycetota bacterium]
MRFIPLATLALLALVTIVPAQPCVSTPIPLVIGLNAGNTTGKPVGLGALDPFYPPISCAISFYGFNDSLEDWYVWVAPTDGTLDLTTCPGFGTGASGFDTSLAIWSGTCPGPLTFVACNGDGPPLECGGYESLILGTPVVAFTTYWIKLNGYFVSEFGAYGLVATFTPAAPTFTLAFTGGAGTLNIDLTDGPPGVDYFTAASFDGTNATFPGTGWFFGLHISLNDLVVEHQI